MDINKILNEFITRNITFFSITLPGFIYAVSIFVPLEYNATLSIGLGTCELLNFTIPIPLKNLLIFIAATINILFLSIAAINVWFVRNIPEKRYELYNTWKVKARYSIAIVLFLFINTLCYKNKGIASYFDFDTGALGFYLFFMVILYIMFNIGLSESKKEMSNKTSERNTKP